MHARKATGRWGGVRSKAAAGFTLVEVTITVIIIAVLAGIFLVAIGRGAIFARASAERQLLTSLKTSVIGFKTDYGFYPPLVKDSMPTGVTPTGETQPNTYMGKLSTNIDQDRAYLQGYTAVAGGAPLSMDHRYSEYSLQYYLMGALDADPNNTGKPIDGAKGPKFTKPNEDGTFAQRGAAAEALFDFGKGGRGLRQSPTQTVLIDRWQTPIRYYRWLPKPDKTTGKAHILIPRCVGDPLKNPALGSAEFALVSLGNDKQTDDRQPREVGVTNPTGPAVDSSVNDDVVEVGP